MSCSSNYRLQFDVCEFSRGLIRSRPNLTMDIVNSFELILLLQWLTKIKMNYY